MMNRTACTLLVIDVQTRLMPAIADQEAVVANIGRLLAAASLLDVPHVFTEQNPAGLGPTIAALAPAPGVPAKPLFTKMAFDGCRDGLLEVLPPTHSLVVAGCEAHVCVLQTVLGLLAAGKAVFVVADALGSRTVASRDAALARMARHGAEIVTTEMVVFEWLGTATDPRFREAVRLIK